MPTMEPTTDWIRLYRTRFDRHYASAKLAADPVYEAVAQALAGSGMPLLDIGCGLGLLVFFLRSRGFTAEIHALDFDARKVAEAARVAREAGIDGVRFECVDAGEGLPHHAGHVTLLDVLQYLPPEKQTSLVRAAAAAVAPGGQLVIRTGLRAVNWRFRLTVLADRLGRAVRWMRSAPICYPERAHLEALLRESGLEGEVRPLWGRTPFHNHLLIYRRSIG